MLQIHGTVLAPLLQLIADQFKKVPPPSEEQVVAEGDVLPEDKDDAGKGEVTTILPEDKSESRLGKTTANRLKGWKIHRF